MPQRDSHSETSDPPGIRFLWENLLGGIWVPARHKDTDRGCTKEMSCDRSSAETPHQRGHPRRFELDLPLVHCSHRGSVTVNHSLSSSKAGKSCRHCSSVQVNLHCPGPRARTASYFEPAHKPNLPCGSKAAKKNR